MLLQHDPREDSGACGDLVSSSSTTAIHSTRGKESRKKGSPALVWHRDVGGVVGKDVGVKVVGFFVGCNVG